MVQIDRLRVGAVAGRGGADASISRLRVGAAAGQAGGRAWIARLRLAAVVCRTRPCVTTDVTLWKITRSDGVVMGFTSYDAAVTREGVTYQPCASLNPTAIQHGTEVGHESNTSIEGIIDVNSISEADVYGGLYDGAAVEIRLYSIEQGAGSIDKILASGWVGNITFGSDGFKMEVLGATGRLSQQGIVETYTATCRFAFGDTRCGVDRSAFQTDGVVASASSRTVMRTTLSAAVAGASYVNGSITWVYGENTGSSQQIKSINFSTGAIVLWEPTPHLPQASDEFTVLPGCDLTFDGGCTLYDNKVRFGGFKDLPGEDATLEAPNATA